MGKQYIRFDWAIKRLLRNKADFSVLEGFLSAVFGDEDMKVIEILESESNQEAEDDKYNRVDLLVRNPKGEIIIIEVQISYQRDYFHRMAFGTAKAITDHIRKGDLYEKIRKIYSINIVYFELGQGSDYVYWGKTVFKGIHNDDILTLTQAQKDAYLKSEAGDIFPEYCIIRVNDFNDYAKDSLDQWIYYLKNNEIKKEFTAKGLNEARQQLEVDNLSDAERISYEHYLKESAIRESEMISAIDKELRRVAINLIKTGMSPEQIGEVTGLSVERIAGLKNDIQEA